MCNKLSKPCLNAIFEGVTEETSTLQPFVYEPYDLFYDHSSLMTFLQKTTPVNYKMKH